MVLNLKLSLFIVVLLIFYNLSYVYSIAHTYMYCNTNMSFYVVKFYTEKNMLHNKIEKLQAAAIYQAVAAYYIDIVSHSCV